MGSTAVQQLPQVQVAPVQPVQAAMQQYNPVQQYVAAPAQQYFPAQQYGQPIPQLYPKRVSPPVVVNLTMGFSPEDAQLSMVQAGVQTEQNVNRDNVAFQNSVTKLAMQQQQWDDKFAEVDPWVRNAVLDGSISKLRHDTELLLQESARNKMAAAAATEESARLSKQLQQQQEKQEALSSVISRGADTIEKQSARSRELMREAATKMHEAMVEKEVLSQKLATAEIVAYAEKQKAQQATDAAEHVTAAANHAVKAMQENVNAALGRASVSLEVAKQAKQGELTTA
jgi:hypothetical protein